MRSWRFFASPAHNLSTMLTHEDASATLGHFDTPSRACESLQAMAVCRIQKHDEPCIPTHTHAYPRIPTTTHCYTRLHIPLHVVYHKNAHVPVLPQEADHSSLPVIGAHFLWTSPLSLEIDQPLTQTVPCPLYLTNSSANTVSQISLYVASHCLPSTFLLLLSCIKVSSHCLTCPVPCSRLSPLSSADSLFSRRHIKEHPSLTHLYLVLHPFVDPLLSSQANARSYLCSTPTSLFSKGEQSHISKPATSFRHQPTACHSDLPKRPVPFKLGKC